MSHVATNRWARERLAEHMEDRRVELRLRWSDVAKAAGVTTETLRQVRYGNSAIQPLTRRAIEEGLRWGRGSVQTILAGGEPTAVQETEIVTIRLPSPEGEIVVRLQRLGRTDEELDRAAAEMVRASLGALSD